MSYDVYLKDPTTGNVIELDIVHHMKGGTYAVGGTNEAHLNITYNYGGIFRQVFGEKGIRSIYGMTGAESLPILEKAIYALGNDTHEDYWKATEGNAKRALINLAQLATLAPTGVWEGD